jgi:hypothetical protein
MQLSKDLENIKFPLDELLVLPSCDNPLAVRALQRIFDEGKKRNQGEPTRELLQQHLTLYIDAEMRGKDLMDGCRVDQKNEYSLYVAMTEKAKHMKEAIEHIFLVLDGKYPNERG